MAAHFLNADLEILSTRPLGRLRDEIGGRANNLHCGTGRDSPFLAVFEIDDDPDEKQPEALILLFCELVESLGEESLQLWIEATRRVIDLGYEVDDKCDRLDMRLEPALLARMAALNIALAFTIYPSDGFSINKTSSPEN